MTPRGTPRTSPMTLGDVRSSAAAARKFDEVARLVHDEDGDYLRVSASLAVLAGIAAADAMCGHVLKECSRGQDHRQAAAMLRSVTGAAAAVPALERLLDAKDSAHYSPSAVSQTAVTSALRASALMVETMESVLKR